MAKYEFEWDDKQAQAVQDLILAAIDTGIPTQGRLSFNNLVQQIEAQKPVPLPTKLGAVIEAGGYHYVRAGSADKALWSRIRPNGEYDGVRDEDQMPDRFNIVAEGVDL